MAAALGIGLLFLFGRSAAELYTDFLWFGAIDYPEVFRTRILTTFTVRLLAAVAAAAIIYLNLSLVLRRLGPVRVRRRYGNLEIAEQIPRTYVVVGSLLIALFGGWWAAMLQFGGAVPLAVRAWANHVPWGMNDPLFGRDISFYIFTLPVTLITIDHLLLAIFWSMLLVMVGYSLVGGLRVQQNRIDIDPFARTHFASLVAAFLVVLAIRYVAGRYLIALGGTGVQGAVGYTDVHARLIGQWVLAALCIAAAASILYSAVRGVAGPAVAGISALVLGGVIFGYAYPAVIQKLKVQPNQLAREQPYIEWNLEFTRRAFGLTDIERKSITYETATPSTWAAADAVLNDLAVWDVDQLLDGFNAVQAFQGYYGFSDVDFDRYMVGGKVEQVGVGVREFRQEGLPAASRNWFALHLRPEFTRGVGAVVAQADVAVGGAPRFLVGELNPIRIAADAAETLALTDPAVYYGELATDYIVLNGGPAPASTVAPDGTATAAPGAPNNGTAPAPAAVVAPVTPHGVSIASFARVLAFAWRFGDYNLLFAGDLDDTSRLLFLRNVRQRAEQVAPFLDWDRDALPVIVDGRVKWVLDGYTTSSTFPLSSSRSLPALNLRAVNYMRGSAKAVVDGVTGAVEIYATDAGDPILRSYAAVFPGLVRASSAMPAWLIAHLRYPVALLTLQADILQLYHVEQANQFFASQDAWEVPTQGAARGTPRPNEPLHLLMPMPGDSTSGFVSMLPFTARARQNLTAMLVVDHDPAAYGRLTLLNFGGDAQIKGPGQIQSLIEQDPEISQQLSLWRQLGTAVELGQLRIVPFGNSVLYIEPLFMAAEERAIPQLHRVIVSDGEIAVMGETLARAVATLSARKGGVPAGDVAGATGGTANNAGAPSPGATTSGTANRAANAPQLDRSAWPAEALRLYDEAERHLRAGDFAAFGASWQRLRTVLQQAAADGRRP